MGYEVEQTEARAAGHWEVGVGPRLQCAATGVGALLFLVCIVSPRAGEAASAAFLRDCAALTRGDHRLTGTSEYKVAADHVSDRLRALGARVIVETFPSTQTEVRRCEMQVEGQAEAIDLLPMRPNGILASVTPPAGLTGRLVYVGEGSTSETADADLRGAIALLDYNCGEGWMRALRLGAIGVVFARRGECQAWHPHYVDACANLPRFFYAGRPEELPIGKTVTIHSEVVWGAVIARNVLGFFEGTDPVFAQEKEEVIVIATNLDSFGEVPRLSPGGRGAANCAALLKLSDEIARNRPRRHVLVAFLDAQSRGHLGSSAFYRALEEDDKKASVEARGEALLAESEFLTELSGLATSDAPLTTDSDVRRRLMNRLRDKAKAGAYDLADRMAALREKRRILRQGGSESDAPEIRAISDRLRGELQPLKDDWNDLRRVLGKWTSPEQYEVEGLAPGVRSKLAAILEGVRADLLVRAAELEVEGRALDADGQILELLGNSPPEEDEQEGEGQAAGGDGEPRDLPEGAPPAETEAEQERPGRWISLHISLLLGDSTPRWGVIIGGESSLHSWDDNPGLYGKVQSAFLRAYRAMEERGKAPEHFVQASVDQSLTKTRVLWGAPFLIHSGEIAGLFGIYNIGVATCQERTVREGTPDDLLERLDLASIESQAAELARMLLPAEGESGEGGYAVFDQEGLSLRRGIVARNEYEWPQFEDQKVGGPMVMGLLPGSTMPDTPMPGAIIQFRTRALNSLSFETRKPYAFDNFQVLRTNQNGVYGMGPVTGGGSWWNGAYGGLAVAFDERGTPALVSGTDTFRQVRYRLNVFRCRAGAFVLPPSLRTHKSAADNVRILSSKASGYLDPKKSFTEMFDGILYWYVGTRERGLKFFGLHQLVGVNNGPETFSGEDGGLPSEGIGFPLGPGLGMTPMTLRSAGDLWRLNDARLNVLRSKNILDSSLAELHGRAEDLLLAAEETGSALRKEALSTSAFWAERPVYHKARGMLDDLVFAVLILLGLSVPFAFAVERVVVGATIVYRQIMWFVIFFLLTFATLFFSHPAFAIANTPIIIFLGFAIVVMSAMVITIIMRKFEVELKALQGMTSTVHAADVSRVSTFVAAMHMGISTMRRRPLRTALTATTVLLLTFTILCFASFGTQSGIVKLFSDPNPPYAGVWVHDVNWSSLSPDLLDLLEGRWSEDGKLFPRYWIAPKTLDNPGLLVTREDGGSPVTVRGVLGLEPEECTQRPDLAELLGTGFEDGVLLNEAVARELEVEVGDRVILGGVPLRVGRILEPSSLSTAKDMDGSSVLPVDFTEVTSEQRTEAPTPESLLSRRNWASLPVASVVIVSAETARELGAALFAATLYTTDTSEATIIAEDLARMLPFPVVATRTNGAYLHLLGTVLAASGVSDLFFPILLGGLVIFGTMLGSVSDREREIYTFSALGLAPRHVATLFFAESAVFSLLGGMGGYLLAQATMKVLTVMSEHGWVVVPEMNMSSTNTIVTILIVMATVLISAIYPAIKASRSANPGLMRVWRPPEPEGDVLDLVFPFTVSQYDVTGVVSFLKEHFDNHTDTGLGHFMSADARLVRDEHEDLGLDAELALAPFDLGVSQGFALRSTPSEIPGINEVRIRLERASGQPKDWQRLNKVFLDDIRKQFLIWRSQPHETMEGYRQRTLVALGGAEGSEDAGAGAPGRTEA